VYTPWTSDSRIALINACSTRLYLSKITASNDLSQNCVFCSVSFPIFVRIVLELLPFLVATPGSLIFLNTRLLVRFKLHDKVQKECHECFQTFVCIVKIIFDEVLDFHCPVLSLQGILAFTANCLRYRFSRPIHPESLICE